MVSEMVVGGLVLNLIVWMINKSLLISCLNIRILSNDTAYPSPLYENCRGRVNVDNEFD